MPRETHNSMLLNLGTANEGLSAGDSAEAGLLPNLIIAGAPKSGTSSVFRWLVDHPEVLGSTMKETYYFVDPETHMFNRQNHYVSGGIAGYRKFFPKSTKLPVLIVEATPSYLYSQLAVRELPLIPTRPHFIFLLREPASQVHSTFRYFQSNWDWIASNLTFSEFLNVGRLAKNQFRGNELAQNALSNAEYVDFLLRWRNACGVDRLHIFLFEEVFSDQRRFMRKLADRFGIDPDFYNNYAFPAENQTYAVRSRTLQKLNISLRSKLPKGILYNGFRSVYRYMNTRTKVNMQQRDVASEISLAERYQKANDRLAKEFDLDLRVWAAVQEARKERQHLVPGRQHDAG